MLRCFGIPVEGPAEVFCDNMTVVKFEYTHISLEQGEQYHILPQG